MRDRPVVPLLLSTFRYPAGHPLEGQPGVSMGYAIKHEEALVLFDTGIGTGSVHVEGFRPVARDVRERSMTPVSIRPLSGSS